MWKVNLRSLRRPAALLVLLAIVGVGGLRNVQVTVPEATAAGDTVTLQCKYDLESDTLYSIKWYKGRWEFFRYIPKELPHTRVFALAGVDVDVGRSGPAAVVLRRVAPSLSGRYRCEVSADAPSFHTAMKTSYMHVVELPEAAPTISSEKPKIYLGETLKVICIAPAAYPPANLTWLLNNVPIKGKTVDVDSLKGSGNNIYKHHGHIQLISQFAKHQENETKIYGQFFPTNEEENEKLREERRMVQRRSINTLNGSELLVGENGNSNMTEKGVADSVEEEKGTSENKLDPEAGNSTPMEEQFVKKESASSLDLVIGLESFHQGRLTLTCKANVFTLYNAEALVIIEGEKPQLAPVLGSRDSSSGSYLMDFGVCWLYVPLLLLQFFMYR